jgi:histidinol phosphatase-like enzyme
VRHVSVDVSDVILLHDRAISIKCAIIAGTAVGKGLIDEQKLLKIHTYMSALLVEQDEDAVLDKIYVCTSTKEQNDPNMKPNPGMIVQACRDFGVSSEDCVFIGDTITDLEAATAAEIPLKVLVSTGYGRSIIGRGAQECAEIIERSSFPAPITPFYYTINLASAVDLLLSMETNALSK